MNKYYLKHMFSILFVVIIAVQSNSVLANPVYPDNSAIQTDHVKTIPRTSHPVNLSPEIIAKIKKMPYNDETFKLSYQTFIYNSNIPAAYQIALIAVEKRPDDIVWHERLAQSAMWDGDYNTGMREWVYLAKHTNDINTIKHAASIAKLFGYDQALVEILKMYLAKNPNDRQIQLDLAQAQNRIDEPNQALSTLDKVNAAHPNRTAYELAADIYENTGQTVKDLKTWQDIDKKFGPDIKSVMTEANIFYSKGKFKQAVDVLKKGIPIAKATDQDFWETLGELAWLVNDRRMAVFGYQHNLNDASHLIRLIELVELTEPNKGLDYSIRGWNRFHKPLFLTSALYLGAQSQDWQAINRLLSTLSPKDVRQAQKLLPFWEVQANMYAYYGADDLQRQILIQGVILEPDMVQLKSDLLWLMMKNGENEHIKRLMELWYEQDYWQDPLLWHAYAEGFDVINKYYNSISMYQMHLSENIDDYQVLIDYANILERAELYQQAYDVRQYIWQRCLLKLNRHKAVDIATLEAISQVSPYFVSGTDQVQVLSDLMNTSMSDQDINLVLNWMVPRGYFDLVAYFKAVYLHNDLPDWAGINLALTNNDLPTMQRILEHTDRQWPRSDRMNAAARLGNTQLVVDYAYAELEERPHASEIYTEFTEFALSEANYISVEEDFEQFVDVAGPRSSLETKLRLTNEWFIRPYVSLWGLRSEDSRSITNLPDNDFRLGFRLQKIIHRGSITYTLGYRNALDSFVNVAIDVNYLLSAGWTANVTLDYNQENFQNSFLRIGGVQDQIGLGLIYNIAKYDQLTLSARELKYYSQDRHYLADGPILGGLFEHKFWLSYPDYTIGFFTNLYFFKRNGSYAGDITTLFSPLSVKTRSNPALVVKDVTDNYHELIPDNYYEGGFTFSFGNTIQEYTHAWRPFFWGSLYYNTLTRISYDVKAGINGSVFGRDSLLAFGELGTAQSTPGQINYIIGLRYMLYF